MTTVATVPMTSSHVKKLEVTEMKICIWECGHTLRDHVINDDIMEITERLQIYVHPLD